MLQSLSLCIQTLIRIIIKIHSLIFIEYCCIFSYYIMSLALYVNKVISITMVTNMQDMFYTNKILLLLLVRSKIELGCPRKGNL